MTMISLVTRVLKLLCLTMVLDTTAHAAANPPESAWQQSWTLHVTMDPGGAPADDATSKALGLAIRMAGGSVDVGNLQEYISFPKPGEFRIKSDVAGSDLLAKVWANARDLRVSHGLRDAAHLTTDRFMDKRGERDVLMTRVDLKARRIEYFDGNRSARTEPVRGAVTDIVALPYYFLGRPPARKPFSVQLIDGKGSRDVTFDVLPASLKVGAGNMDALLLKARRQQAGDASIEIWLRPADGLPMHVRIGLNAKYGVVLEENLDSVPAEREQVGGSGAQRR